MVKNVQNRSKKDQERSSMVNTVKNGQYGQNRIKPVNKRSQTITKWSETVKKWSKTVEKRSKTVCMVTNGQN